MAGSANALYVLRLVWRGPGPMPIPRSFRGVGSRQFSFSSRASTSEASTSTLSSAPMPTATAPAAQTLAADSAAATPSVTAANTCPPGSDFLESDESEYTSASSFLPHRSEAGVHPIPWPTIFQHADGHGTRQTRKGKGKGNNNSGTPSSTPRAGRPCDLVARLVAEGRLEPAREVYAQLRALNTAIEPRKIYLSAAVASLHNENLGPEAQRADFLFWLGLYPNRPATRSHPSLKATWAPIVNTVLSEHMELRFVADFLLLAGKKGLLAPVFPSMLAPLVAIAPPDVSERTLDAAISAYRAATTSKTSTSKRAQDAEALTAAQTAACWNSYIRRLKLCGWDESARALLYSPPEGVRWSVMSRTVVLGHGLQRRAAAVAAAQARDAAERENPLLGLGRVEARSLPERVRAVAGMAAATAMATATGAATATAAVERLPSVVELAAVQSQLEALGRFSLLARLRARFLRSVAGRTVPAAAERWWIHAELMRLVDAEAHGEAVALFNERFLWIGLPRPSATVLSATTTATTTTTSTSQAQPPPASLARLIPTIQVITSILPSILALEPHPAAYHARYLANVPRLPPILAPTAYTHLAFVRTLAARAGIASATEALTTIMSTGADPGLPAWNALLVALQGRGEVDAALRLLSSLETGASVSGSGSGSSAAKAMPAPNARTYLGLIHVAAKAGKESQALFYLKRFKKFVNVNAARGRNVSVEDRALLDIAKKAAKGGKKRKDGEGEAEAEAEKAEAEAEREREREGAEADKFEAGVEVEAEAEGEKRAATAS